MPGAITAERTLMPLSGSGAVASVALGDRAGWRVHPRADDRASGDRSVGQSASAGSPSRSTPVPTVTGHGLHCKARGGEELTDLGGVLNDVQRHAADNHREQHSVVSMRAWKWPSGHLLGEAVKGLAYATAAPVDVPEKLGLGEPAVGEAVGVVVKRLWRCPPLGTPRPGIIRRGLPRGFHET